MNWQVFIKNVMSIFDKARDVAKLTSSELWRKSVIQQLTTWQVETVAEFVYQTPG